MPSTALLVIDIQRGAFDGLRCPPMDSPEQLVESAGALVEAAREGGRPIVFIQHCDGAGEPFEEGTAHWQLHESLVPQAGDTVLKKYASSSFEGTELDALLKAKGVGELVVCGLQSEFCVSNTTRSALGLGYRVKLAQDGHGTWPSGGRSAADIRAEANAKLAEAGAALEGTERLAAALRQR
ncbi:MAG TPA: cysteine hydrolase family protein [Ideonella sp.]|jgi:nicotinamidase-related amidase|nr:cysteine hydrolase family protein [Ideonella sp.]